VTRAQWLNQASALLVAGRCNGLALRALKQLARLDTTIEQLEGQVPDEVRHQVEPDEQLMTVAELLRNFDSERRTWRSARLLPDILSRAAAEVRRGG
jgi:hypothetical protein